MARACKDENYTDTDCTRVADEIIQYVYTVTVPRSIWTPSVQDIIPVNINTTALFEFQYPETVQLSNTPLHGHYQIECFNKEGEYARTGNIGYSTGAGSIYGYILDACPWVRDKIHIFDMGVQRFKEDGINWRIYFSYMEASLP